MPVDAAVMRPSAPTVMLASVYDPAPTPEAGIALAGIDATVVESVASAEPLNETLPVTFPLRLSVREATQRPAVVALPFSAPVTVKQEYRVVLAHDDHVPLQAPLLQRVARSQIVAKRPDHRLRNARDIRLRPKIPQVIDQRGAHFGSFDFISRMFAWIVLRWSCIMRTV